MATRILVVRDDDGLPLGSSNLPWPNVEPRDVLEIDGTVAVIRQLTGMFPGADPVAIACVAPLDMDDDVS